MATGVEMVKNTPEHSSDLDLIVYAANPIAVPDAQELVSKLNQFGVHADVQVVNGQNGFSLEEYAANRSAKILVKTSAGPVLANDPWRLLLKQAKN